MPNGIVGTFKRAEYSNTDTFDDFCAEYRDLDLPPQQLRRLFEAQKNDVIYLSEHYQVAIDKHVEHGFPGQMIWHLSIKRIDKEPIMDWRDLQTIKNQLAGPEIEAIQVFPAESRLVDTSNQYHLWAFMKTGGKRAVRLPIGWNVRMVTDKPGGNAKQRPT
jgi:hypothetical protein